MKAVIGFLLILLGLTLLVVFMPPLEQPRSQARRMESLIRLKDIGLALSAYEADYGILPPAVVVDEEGNLLYSWRVLLLPYLESRDLYERFDLGEPWDSPENLPLVSEMPTSYACPHLDSAKGETAFLALVSAGEPRTAMLPETSQTLAEISAADGLAATAMVVEDRTHPVIWSQPLDVSPEEFLDRLPQAERFPAWIALVTCDANAFEIENPQRHDVLPLMYADDRKVP